MVKNKRLVGRPNKYEFNEDDLKLIKETINGFNKEHNEKSIVKYKDIHEFCVSLNSIGDFPFKLSYDFWKREGRMGRVLIDEYNSVQKKKIRISKSDNLDIVDILDLLDKYGGDNKKILMQHLSPLNDHINRFLNEINNLEEKNLHFQNELEKKQQENLELKAKLSKLQTVMMSMFTYSNGNNELVNMLNTGSSNSHIINLALEETFGSPNAFVDELINNNGSKLNQKEDNKMVLLRKNNIIEPEFEL